MFSPDAIEQVTAANDIVEVIGAYVPLKRAGSRYRALCPFHTEKTPSFNVDPRRQRYHCFGCGAGGSVIGFVMAYESLDFPAAVRRLAERAGVVLVEESRPEEDRGAGALKRRLLALHAEAAAWFHRNLMRSPAAQPARDYLKGRGLTAEVAARWQLGFAPDAWDALSAWGAEQGYTAEELLAGGLLKTRDDPEDARENQRAYDRFRNRLMFPIANEMGETIGFSGRVLGADDRGAKYLNSPETPIFTKGKVLFGLHRAKRAMTDAGFAIVCEGQIDLITAYEAGVQNVIAPQGTAFTGRQAQILKRQVDQVVLCFDSDGAGQQAAERSFPALLECNLTVRVATMPPGEDPDSLIRKGGAEAFRERIGQAQDFFDFQIERLSGQFDLGTPRGKSQFARRLAESVALLTDGVLREATVEKVSARLGLSPEVFRPLLKAQPRLARPQPDLRAAGPKEEPAPAFEKPPAHIAHLIRLAIEHPEARRWLLQQPWRESLPHAAGAELLARTLEAAFDPEDTTSVNAFLATLEPAEESFVSGLLMERPFPQPMALVRGGWAGLESSHLRERLASLQSRMRVPGVSPMETTQIQKEVLDLQGRLHDIARP